MKLKASQGKAKQGRAGEGAHHTYLHSFLICRCFSLNAVGFLWFPVPAKRRHVEALAGDQITRQGAAQLRPSSPSPARTSCHTMQLPVEANICMRHLNAARTGDFSTFTTH